MMDRKTSIALVAAGREIRAAVRKLAPLAPGEQAEAALGELKAVAHRLEMLPSAPPSQPPAERRPLWRTGPLDPLPDEGNSRARRRPSARAEIKGVTGR